MMLADNKELKDLFDRCKKDAKEILKYDNPIDHIPCALILFQLRLEGKLK